MQEVDFPSAFPKSNFEGHVSHKFFFIKAIVEEFVRMQATYVAKRVTLSEHKLMLRSKLKKKHSFPQSLVCNN